MPDSIATVISALIGAGIGSIGSTFLESRLRRKKEKQDKLEKVVKLYLFQLQDALEALWHRLDNLEYRHGREVMEDHYFEISTLYVFGRVIAYARILMIEGVYSDLVTFDEQFGKAIKEKLKDLERLMKGFHKYDRFALADALIECEKGYSKVCSYLAFKQHYEQDLLRSNNLLPAREFLSTLSGQMVKNALRIIEEMLEQIKKQTKIPTTVQQSTK